MIVVAFLRALGQLPDPAFQRVLWRGVGLAVAALLLLTLLLTWGTAWLLPDAVTLPWWGPVTWLDDAAGWALVPVALLASVLLMVPVASAIIGAFLDDVAEAVERRHYPDLRPVPPLPWAVALRDSAAFLGLVLVANVAAFAVYLLIPPIAPLVFVAVNGWLLGREYGTLAATRRLGREGARAFVAAHGGTLWLAGALMAAPLAVPLVNLLVPVIGAATFVHLVDGLLRRAR